MKKTAFRLLLALTVGCSVGWAGTLHIGPGPEPNAPKVVRAIRTTSETGATLISSRRAAGAP